MQTHHTKTSEQLQAETQNPAVPGLPVYSGHTSVLWKSRSSFRPSLSVAVVDLSSLKLSIALVQLLNGRFLMILWKASPHAMRWAGLRWTELCSPSLLSIAFDRADQGTRLCVHRSDLLICQGARKERITFSSHSCMVVNDCDAMHVSIFVSPGSPLSLRNVSSIRRMSSDIIDTSFFGFLFFAFRGLSSSNSSSSSCVASKFAFLLSGSKGGRAVLASSATQSIDRIQGCCFSVSKPPDPRHPSLLCTSRSNSYRCGNKRIDDFKWMI